MLLYSNINLDLLSLNNFQSRLEHNNAGCFETSVKF